MMQSCVSKTPSLLRPADKLGVLLNDHGQVSFSIKLAAHTTHCGSVSFYYFDLQQNRQWPMSGLGIKSVFWKSKCNLNLHTNLPKMYIKLCEYSHLIVFCSYCLFFIIHISFTPSLHPPLASLSPPFISHYGYTLISLFLYISPRNQMCSLYDLFRGRD